VLLALGAWAFYALASVAARGGESAPLYSAYRHDPYGTAALRELLDARGVNVATLERPRLDADSTGVLVQVISGGDTSIYWPGASPQLQTDALRNWILAGNTVVQFTATSTDLMAACGVAFTGDDLAGAWTQYEKAMRKGDPPDAVYWHSVDAAWTATALERMESRPGDKPRQLTLQSPGMLPREPTATWRPLAVTPRGAVAGEKSVGDGRLVVVASPSPALNAWLAEGGNLEFVLAMVGDETVYMDEWSHGIGHSGTIIGIIQKAGLLPLIFQVIVALLIYVWSTMGHRRQDVEQPHRRRSSGEQIVTLGHLYSQSLSAADLAQRAHEEVIRRLSEALRCTPANVSRRAALRGPAIAQKVEHLLASRSRVLQPQDPSCPRCGYNLRGNPQAANCPECGLTISDALRRSIEQPPPAASQLRDRRRIEDHVAQLLTESHQLEKELTRDRREH
jgi:hypothetical protein